MQTYSHFLITALIWDLLRRRNPPIRAGKAFLLGSVLPDVPLILLTIGYYISNKISGSNESTFGERYDELYFHNPFWIVVTSLFHAPFLILFYGLAGWALHKWDSAGRLGKAGMPLCWFALACALHTLIDIPTHAGDGPALLFPFEWHVRFNSPVSYYDPEHYGDIFIPIEAVLDVALILYFLVRCVCDRRRPRSTFLNHMTNVEFVQISERKSHRSDAGSSISEL